MVRWGSREAEIRSLRMCGPAGDERYHFRVGETVTVELDVEAKVPLDDVVFGLALSTPRGVEVWGSNTDLGGFAPGRLASSGTVRACFSTLRLAPGEYAFDAAIHTRAGAPYDYRRKALEFSITGASDERGVGIYFPEHRWEFSGDLEVERDSS